MRRLPLALSAASGAAESKLRELRVGIVYAIAVLICALLALVFFVIALALALTDRLGAIQACLILGATFTVVAGIVAYQRRRSMRRARLIASVEARNAMIGSVASGLAASPKTTSLLALAAGFLLSRR